MDIRRIARIEDNNDPEKYGRVRARIFPEFESLDKESLPWSYPYIEGDVCIPGKNTGFLNIPEIGSYVIVLIDPTWQEFRYTGISPAGKKSSGDKSIATNITEELTNLVDGVDVTYPQPLYLLRTKDGAIAYHNTDNGEMGIVSSNGIFLRYDSSGNFIMGSKDGSRMTLGTDGSLKFSGKANGDSSFVLFEPLKEILEKLLNHIHVAPNGPTTAAQEANGTPLSTLKGNLSEMESK